MGTEPSPPTLAEIVRRAAEVVDADGHDESVWALVEAFEEREDILRLAARAEYDGAPPPHVRDWLAAAGVAV